MIVAPRSWRRRYLRAQVDAIYKAEDALRAKAAEQAAKASAASASGGDAASAPAPSRPSGGEMELTSLLPGQMRTPLAGAGAGAATSSAPAPPVVGGMMGAVVTMDADGGVGAGAGNARLYVVLHLCHPTAAACGEHGSSV